MKSELVNILASRSVKHFYETDDAIYPITEKSYHRFGQINYVTKYEPFFLRDAALETLIDYGLVTVNTRVALATKMTREICEEAVKRIPNFQEIELGRLATAQILNNYGGDGLVYSPN